MVDWGLDKSDMWPNPESGTILLENNLILKGVVDQQTLTIEYGKDWEMYLNVPAYPQFIEKELQP